ATLNRRYRRPIDIAVGGFRDHVIESGGGLSIRLQQLGVRTYVPRHKNPQRLSLLPCGGDFQLDRGRAQEMTRVPVSGPYSVQNIEPAFILNWPESVERSDGFRLGVNGLHLRAVARNITAVELRDFSFLNISRVGKKIRAKVDRSACCHYWAAKALLYQLRQHAAVVDMRVR